MPARAVAQQWRPKVELAAVAGVGPRQGPNRRGPVKYGTDRGWWVSQCCVQVAPREAWHIGTLPRTNSYATS